MIFVCMYVCINVCMYVCMNICIYVCKFPHNSRTARPIWIKIFLLAPSWLRENCLGGNPGKHKFLGISYFANLAESFR